MAEVKGQVKGQVKISEHTSKAHPLGSEGVKDVTHGPASSMTSKRMDVASGEAHLS